MVSFLRMGIPAQILDRSHLDQKQLAHFEKVTGIKKTRRYYPDTMSMILKTVGDTDFSDADALIVVTQSPDRLSPCMATELHHKLGLQRGALAFDVNHACDGWIVGLHLAYQLQVDKVLLICADRLRYNKTPIEGLIFSDSVSITEIDRRVMRQLPVFKSYTDGSKSESLYCGLDGKMDMDGNDVFDFVVGKVASEIKHFNQFGAKKKILVPHQANLSMLKLLAMRTGFSGNWLSSVEEYGNQSMNSVPMAIAYNQADAIYQNLLLAGFGAGYSAAFMTLYWDNPTVEIVEIE